MIFDFEQADLIGTVRAVDTRKVLIMVGDEKDLRKARVGHFAALNLSGASDDWLIGIIERVIKSIGYEDETENEQANDLSLMEEEPSKVINTVLITLVGMVRWNVLDKNYQFSRSIVQVPEISAECYVLQYKQLENFMNLLVKESDKEHSLELGKYSIDDTAVAYLDGNKLFQRHAALLGSTGSGKSFTVASILERAAKLPTANIIVFDLHGEYKELSYARHLRIPGPEELGVARDDLLFLPYWLLNAEEMQAMFIDRSEFSAHNQVMVFQDAVVEQKKATLSELGKTDVLAAFTLDSPIPFSIDNVINTLSDLNEEMEQGARGLKQGKFYGQFSRLLVRIKSKLSDKRYGFLFQAPNSEHLDESMARIAAKLMDYNLPKSQIKVVDFSEVPVDVLPVIVGLVARMIYQIQFWTDHEKRRPLACICDEAHLYLPRKEGQNPVERRAIEAFEKIAKEGRKYGVALLIVSQRPSDVSPTILSQCNNIIALRLANADDQNTVKKLMPESMESLLDILPIMDIGEALVVGDAVLLPSRIRVNRPSEEPLSATVNFWTEWQKKAKDPDFKNSVENMRRQGRK
ncbi:MAG TPA: ATPase [Syntrophomonas wolfei]|uniref:ATPase n=1 Tax=Syntrophomonas wolfei TaxID=863 RepID=A0A354YZ92_9FIRM|nr:ATPase [Syntrophomonas wolfei]